MDTTNESPSKLGLFDNIDQSLKKAKAISRLMAYAANEGSLDHGDELIWAHQVVGNLIDDAMKSVAILANQQLEASA